jgi:hypothetical protein
MEVKQLQMPKDKAEAELKSLKEALKRHAQLKKEEIRKDLMAVYGHLKHGKKIIDVYESFRKAGLNSDGDPKLAICRADSKQCYCLKIEDGSAIFAMERPDRWQRQPRKTLGEVKLPAGTFQWQPTDQTHPLTSYNIKNQIVTCPTPIIPAKILVEEANIDLETTTSYGKLNPGSQFRPKTPSY